MEKSCWSIYKMNVSVNKFMWSSSDPSDLLEEVVEGSKPQVENLHADEINGTIRCSEVSVTLLCLPMDTLHTQFYLVCEILWQSQRSRAGTRWGEWIRRRGMEMEGECGGAAGRWIRPSAMCLCASRTQCCCPQLHLKCYDGEHKWSDKVFNGQRSGSLHGVAGLWVWTNSCIPSLTFQRMYIHKCTKTTNMVFSH